MSVSSNALNPGDRIQRYIVKSVLGEGGFGIVYLAEHRWLGYEVVIKEYFPNKAVCRQNGEVLPLFSEEIEFYQNALHRFELECQTLLNLDHPNVVYVYDSFYANNTAYMVMHYEQGTTLDHYFSRFINQHQRGCYWDEIQEPMFCIMDALAFIHERSIFHRDVKPQNIFIRQPSQQPLLLDFGAVKLSSGRLSRYAPRTEGYAAPEQMGGDDYIGPWTDVHGIAATIVRLLSAHMLPYTEERPATDGPAEQDPMSQLIDVVAMNENVALAEVLWSALKPSVKSRIQTIPELQQRLRQVSRYR
ncbi:serine/threonine-protein kinase [Pseudomaricurvus sp. HS19]|uniref:serine/threonine protein kinase n=1 Tax=Pseudomaricurvus sp. HS19 TaxID=2692626 RepID=UPI00136AF8A9|nr:serine/threonine-protein kinase [Pseudomaricurvus sp. HS19]MYM64771.1 protein kinase [Pseudomaricurvus sp. HS19]